jgi:hypothetical protein
MNGSWRIRRCHARVVQVAAILLITALWLPGIARDRTVEAAGRGNTDKEACANAKKICLQKLNCGVGAARGINKDANGYECSCSKAGLESDWSCTVSCTCVENICSTNEVPCHGGCLPESYVCCPQAWCSPGLKCSTATIGGQTVELCEGR